MAWNNTIVGRFGDAFGLNADGYPERDHGRMNSQKFAGVLQQNRVPNLRNKLGRVAHRANSAMSTGSARSNRSLTNASQRSFKMQRKKTSNPNENRLFS